MTVYKIGKNKIKITLTDSEVLSFFGKYENLLAVSNDAKLTVGLILRESLADYQNELSGDLLIEIRARKTVGCIITVSETNRRNSYEGLSAIFEFSGSEELIAGTKRLYTLRRHIISSSLYRLNKYYRLLLTLKENRDLFFMKEFCRHESYSPTEVEYTKEYGKLITQDNAVEKISEAF